MTVEDESTEVSLREKTQVKRRYSSISLPRPLRQDKALRAFLPYNGTEKAKHKER